MSFAFLKNVIFSSRRESRHAIAADVARPIPNEKTTSEKNDLRLPGDNDSESERTLDVEAQQTSDDCRSPQDVAKKSKRKGRFNPSPRMISDAIIGLSDGLTVPFALTAGLSSLGDTRLVVLGGLAELIAGAISMGLGGLLGAKSEAESYKAQVRDTEALIRTSPRQTFKMVATVFEPYGLSPSSIGTINNSLQDAPSELLDFLMRFHHQMPEPETSRPFVSAATIALGYFFGGFIPLLPYFCVSRDAVLEGLWISIGLMVFTLFIFGWVKTGVVRGWRGRRNIGACLRGALEMVAVGSIAAGAAVGLVRAINHGQDN